MIPIASSRLLIAFSSIALLSASLIGCAAQPEPKPTGMPKLEIPDGAQLVAYGTYPPAAFAPSRAGGTLYVYDEESKQLLVTSYPEIPITVAVTPLSVSDFPGMDKKILPGDHVRVYYVPKPTTRPNGG